MTNVNTGLKNSNYWNVNWDIGQAETRQGRGVECDVLQYNHDNWSNVTVHSHYYKRKFRYFHLQRKQLRFLWGRIANAQKSVGITHFL